MGTNFFFFTHNKEAAKRYAPYSYELVDEPDFGYEIHVGKRSGGWLPLFQAHKGGMQSVADFKMAYDTGEFKIYDEYGNEFDWDGFNAQLLRWNGGVKGAIPREKIEQPQNLVYYDPDLPEYKPISHFDYGHGKYADEYFKDDQGYEFTAQEFS